ncbi:MAG: signal peptidase II [Coriobacteriales bacterium]|nr:signal peptidase II [Coriobacteriales bacterium]
MRRRHVRTVSLVVFAVGACMVVVLDRVTKSLAEAALSGGGAQPFLPGIIDFRLVYNTGAAWGMFEGARALFLVIALVALAAMLLYLLSARRHALLELLGLALVAGGAVGNAIDRAQSGRVVDFIHPLFVEFPLFNLADSAITVGAVLFVAYLLFGGRGAEGVGGATGSMAGEQGEGQAGGSFALSAMQPHNHPDASHHPSEGGELETGISSGIPLARQGSAVEKQHEEQGDAPH